MRWLFLIPLLAAPIDLSRAGEAFVVTPGQRQLFLDDHGIAKLTDISRVMHQPIKRGAVVRPDVPSDGSLIELRSTPIWDEEKQQYRMFYAAMPMDDHRLIGMGMATSQDGLKWDKPNLEQGIDIRGSSKNNRIHVEHMPGVRDTFFLNVVYDPDDPDSGRRYKGLYGDVNRIPIVSPDGIRWTKLNILPLGSGDESSLVYEPSNRRFLAWLKGSNPFGRAHNLTISKDFQTWSPLKLSFGADEGDQQHALAVIRQRVNDPRLSRPVYVDDDPALGKPVRSGPRTWGADCYFITVFPYEGQYIGLPSMFYPTGVDGNGNNCDGFDIIQLASTRDLLHWNRLGEREPFLPPGRIDDGLVGVWDRMQMFATNPILKQDELWIYYSALKWRDDPYLFNSDRTRRDPITLSAEEKADQAEGMGAICLAVLRRDGFISLDAHKASGSVTTKPFRWNGDALWVNATTQDSGELRVEVLSQSGDLLAVSHAIQGDHKMTEVHWQQGQLNMLIGREVSLRFTLRQTSLYSYWTTP